MKRRTSIGRLRALNAMSRLASLRRALSAPCPTVRYNPKTKCFVHATTGKRYRGITDVTKRLAPSGKGCGGTREIVAGPKGRRRGTLVDTQAAAVFNTPGVKLKTKMHPYTAKLLSALKAEGLQRVRAQVAVADVDHRVATAVDFVCYRPADDSLVLIELKCGFESSDPVWLAKQERSHALQLAVTKYLFRLTYPGIKRVRALVFRVHSAGVRVHGVPAEVKAMVSTTLEQIQVRKKTVYKKRAFKKKHGRRGGGVGGAPRRRSPAKTGGAQKGSQKGGAQKGAQKGGAQKGGAQKEEARRVASAGQAGGARKRKAESGGGGGEGGGGGRGGGAGAKRPKRTA